MKLYDCGIVLFFIIFGAVFAANVLSNSCKELEKKPVKHITIKEQLWLR